MNDERIEASTGVCLVGSGHVCAEVLAKALKFAPELIAADGGADASLAAGHTPRAVIGDFDSISDGALDRLKSVRMIRVAEQDSTDFEKCLSRINAPFIVAVGFTGGRLDHTLAAMSALARRIGPPTYLLDEHDVTFAPGHSFEIDLAPGTRVSLFPMADVSGRSTGLRWPIDGLNFAPAGRIGTSNEATGRVQLEFDGPGMLVILPADEAQKVIPQPGG